MISELGAQQACSLNGQPVPAKGLKPTDMILCGVCKPFVKHGRGRQTSAITCAKRHRKQHDEQTTVDVPKHASEEAQTVEIIDSTNNSRASLFRAPSELTMWISGARISDFFTNLRLNRTLHVGTMHCVMRQMGNAKLSTDRYGGLAMFSFFWAPAHAHCILRLTSTTFAQVQTNSLRIHEGTTSCCPALHVSRGSASTYRNASCRHSASRDLCFNKSSVRKCLLLFDSSLAVGKFLCKCTYWSMSVR